MKERRILFNADEVRAILSGHKTQTRRVMKTQPTSNPDVWVAGLNKSMTRKALVATWDETSICINPFGQVGDSLWVGETFNTSWCDEIIYKADSVGGAIEAGYESEPKWKPSTHMRRWASRITLEITGIRVERLNDISRGDCMSEGCPFPNVQYETDPVKWYKERWESINGAGSWATNPWVWAITFKQIGN